MKQLIILLCWGFIFFPKQIFAQDIEADKLKYKEARMLLYDKPEKAISISKIATNFYKENKAKKEQFSFRKVSKKLNLTKTK